MAPRILNNSGVLEGIPTNSLSSCLRWSSRARLLEPRRSAHLPAYPLRQTRGTPPLPPAMGTHGKARAPQSIPGTTRSAAGYAFASHSCSLLNVTYALRDPFHRVVQVLDLRTGTETGLLPALPLKQGAIAFRPEYPANTLVAPRAHDLPVYDCEIPRLQCE